MGGAGAGEGVGDCGEGAGGGGDAAGVYLMGDSLERKARRLGSRSRRGSEVEGGLEGPQGQPIVGWLGGDWVGGLESRRKGGVECQDNVQGM